MSNPSPSSSIEETESFAPRFNDAGLIACITVDDRSGAVLMVAWMNQEALRHTMRTGVVHYWSRSRKALWRKGATSGAEQRLVRLYTDCDQDVLLARVAVAPSAQGRTCHTGRASCFYREIVSDESDESDEHNLKLQFV